MKLQIIPTEEQIPQASSCPDHSLFSLISEAQLIKNPKIVSPHEFKESQYEIITLNGQWKRMADLGNISDDVISKEFDDFGWNDVFVPNNYGLEGALQRHYDPVWYRRKFQLAGKQYIELHFEGVDYFSEVWMNGTKLGTHEGYFTPFYFDITENLENNNVLIVKVTDPCENLDPDGTIRSHLKKYIKGTMNYHDSRPGGLPGKLSPKWFSEWGQSLTTGGITQPVYLKCTGNISIFNIFTTTLDLNGMIHLAIILVNKQTDPLETTLNLKLTNPAGEIAIIGIHCTLKPGPNRLDLELQIPKPVLWYPITPEFEGTPKLYHFTAQAIEGETLSDELSTSFGIRTVRLTFNPWKFLVNDQYLFIKAVNYIPRQHFADVDESFYQKDMQMIKDAYLNSVGVHAHVQCKPCYNVTDNEGILVFQDFPLQWGYDSSVKRNPGFRDKACKQISEMIYLLYNHPSVVYWCCHNEPPALFIDLERDEIDDNDNQVLDELLEATVRRIDTSRPVHRASGLGEDLHVYDGSLGGGSIYKARERKSGFISEFGFWSIAETALKWGDVGWPPTEEELVQWSSRCSFFGSTSTFIGHPKYYPSREEWFRASLLYGAFLAKFQAELFRSQKASPYNAIRWHFWSDWWGWAGGGLVDVDRTPKLPYYWYKGACRPLILIADLTSTIYPPNTSITIPIILVNDYNQELQIDYTYELLEVSGSRVIAGDANAAALGGTGASCVRRHKIALPLDEPDIIHTIVQGKKTIKIAPHEAKLVDTIQFATPDTESNPSYLIKLTWTYNGAEDSNWAHFMVGNIKAKMKPGLHLVVS